MKIKKGLIYLLAVTVAAAIIFTAADRVPAFIRTMISEAASAKATGQRTKIDNLILVNKDNSFYDEPEGLVSIYENKTKTYFVKDKLVLINKEAMSALNDMMDGFYKATSLKTVIVTSAYRSVETQNELYNKIAAKNGTAYAKRYAQKPGNSEHHTGLAVDLGLFYEDSGASDDFDGKGDYAWFVENCHKYGFILRYPQDKEELTGIGSEPWHFRYVGKSHAKYIMKHGLCLEEYLGKLS